MMLVRLAFVVALCSSALAHSCYGNYTTGEWDSNNQLSNSACDTAWFYLPYDSHSGTQTVTAAVQVRVPTELRPSALVGTQRREGATLACSVLSLLSAMLVGLRSVPFATHRA